MSKLFKFKKLLTFLTCSVLTVSLISAYSVNQRGDNSVQAKTIAEIQEERKQKEEQIAALEKNLTSLEGSKANEKKYQETLSEQISLIQNNILLLETEINQLSNDITAAEDNIKTLNNDIDAQQVEVDANIELFKERLCAMYVSGNDSLASAVLGSTDFYDMLSRYEMVNNIAAHDEELVDKLLEEINKLEETKSTVETEKLNLEMYKQTREQKKEEMDSEIEGLNEKYKKSQEEIDRLALEAERLNKSKDQLEADKKALDKQEEEIRAAEEAARKAEEKRKAEEAARLKAAQQAANTPSNNTTSSNNNSQSSNNSGGDNSNTAAPVAEEAPVATGGFAWPAPGYYYISSGYGSRWGTTHRGIDIAGGGISGASACASKSGTVIAVNNSCTHNYKKTSNCCGNGYGNYVLISHGDGTTTLYGHLASVSVSVGDSVSQGQAVGAIGCTGYSTGFHLHFEIRVNGSAVNPSNYL